jgi:uncharacterized protein (DUF433 family)
MAEITEPIPLETGADGVRRVTGTRVALETVVTAFTDGATAEEIARQHPSLSLADVYQVIGYYLRHSTELEPYLAERRKQMEETRETNEGKRSPDGLTNRLRGRRKR